MNIPDNRFPRGCKLIELPNVVDDRGMLAFGEGGRQIPFEIKRIFWTYHIKGGNVRGDHAHRSCSMVLFPIGGSYSIELDDGSMRLTLRMDDPHIGVLIPPGVWCRLFDFTQQAACISLASEPYEAEDYIHDYSEFLEFVSQL